VNKKILIAVIIIVILAAIGGAYYYTSNQDDGTITIGCQPSDHHAALYIAQAQQQYEKQGLKVKTVQFNNGGDEMTALASGELDVAYVGTSPALSSIEKGVPAKIVGSAQEEGSSIVVSTNSTITSVKDLKGKKVATLGEASIQNTLLKYALKQNGVNPSDVEIVAMKPANMNDALKSGKIDAMVNPEPYPTTAVMKGYGKILENSSEIVPGHPCCVIVASDNFIKNHPTELSKILKIHENATNFINQNPSQAAKLLPKDLVSNTTIEEQSLKNGHFVSGLSSDFKQSVTNFMQIEIDLGLMKEKLSNDKLFYDVNSTSN
jgi:NitT/TauT family transport system substrate-binding protein